MKIVISGYGKMGHMVREVLLSKGIEALPTEDVCSVDPEVAKESVCIDFTTPDAFKANYKFLCDNFKAVVVGTTGWDDIADQVRSYFEKKGTTMIYSSNYSIGVNAVFAATETLGRILKLYDYRPHIEETHHVHKLDAPSGTAKTLAGVVDGSLGTKPDITSIRQGEVNGIHLVEFVSDCDKICLSHEAFSREGFARGAVAAALMTEGLKGVHLFSDLLLK